MIFLDANALYWYLGRDKLGIPSTQRVDEKALRAFLDNQTEKSLPSSVYMEIITHFINSPHKLKTICNFINDRDFKIYNNFPHYCFTPYESSCLATINNQQLSCYANQLLDRKIDIEVSFVVTFLETVRLLYLEYRRKRETTLTESQQTMLMYHTGKQLSESNVSKYKSVFKDTLEKGYIANNEAKTIKDCYVDALNEECVFINLFIELLKYYEDENANLIDILQTRYTELVATGFGIDDPEKKTMTNIVDELKQDGNYLAFAKEEIARIFTKKNFSSHQSKYIRDVMLTAWFERGQKLRKNDIFDMLCVSVLDCSIAVGSCILCDNRSRLISFDGTMKSFLQSKSPCSYQLIGRFEY